MHKAYDRCFIILTPESSVSGENRKEAVGRCVIELRGYDGKFSISLQNLEADNKYRLLFAAFENGTVRFVDLLSFHTDNRGRCETSMAFNTKYIQGTDISFEKINAVVIVKDVGNEVKLIMKGFMGEEFNIRAALTEYAQGSQTDTQTKTIDILDEKPETIDFYEKMDTATDTGVIEEEAGSIIYATEEDFFSALNDDIVIMDTMPGESTAAELKKEDIADGSNIPKAVIKATEVVAAMEAEEETVNADFCEKESTPGNETYAETCAMSNTYMKTEIKSSGSEIGEAIYLDGEVQTILDNSVGGNSSIEESEKDPLAKSCDNSSTNTELFKEQTKKFNQKIEELIRVAANIEPQENDEPETESVHEEYDSEIAAQYTGDSCFDYAEYCIDNYPPDMPFSRQNIDARWIRVGTDELGRLPINEFSAAQKDFIEKCYNTYKHFIFGRYIQAGEINYILGVPDRYDFDKRMQIFDLGFKQFKPVGSEQLKTGAKGYWLMVD